MEEGLFQLVKKFHVFMKSEVSSPFSQKPDMGPNTQPVQCSSHLTPNFQNTKFFSCNLGHAKESVLHEAVCKMLDFMVRNC
jgi:hypothetical protein